MVDEQAESNRDEIVVVFKTSDSLEAHALAAELNNEGIDARVVGDFLSGGMGLTVGTMNLAEIWVPAAEADLASQLLAKWRPDSSPPAPKVQFSLRTALIAMTLVAIAVSISTLDALPATLLWLFEIALWFAAMFVVIERWTRGRRVSLNRLRNWWLP